MEVSTMRRIWYWRWSVLFVAPGCKNKAEKLAVDVPEDKLAAEVDWPSREWFEESCTVSPSAAGEILHPEGMAVPHAEIMQEELAYREARR
jgi:hypothetical protein